MEFTTKFGPKLFLWFTELQTDDMALSCRTKQCLHKETTPFQELAVIDTLQFGRMLVLDNVIQTTIEDEFVYHEMICHVAMNTHIAPKKVLVIGGGDGGVVREAVKHQVVEEVIHCEIDEAVINASKKYLPEISCALDHPKVKVIVGDGIKHVKEKKEHYDVIIIDSTDPVGPAEGLFSLSFYNDIYNALAYDGIFIAQTGSPFFNRKLISRLYKDISGMFPLTRIVLANVPTYPGGLWTLTMGSKRYDPLQVDIGKIPRMDTRYYSPEVHHSSLVLPPFVKELL